jgi:hypothetical protein
VHADVRRDQDFFDLIEDRCIELSAPPEDIGEA